MTFSVRLMNGIWTLFKHLRAGSASFGRFFRKRSPGAGIAGSIHL